MHADDGAELVDRDLESGHVRAEVGGRWRRRGGRVRAHSQSQHATRKQ